MSSIIHEVGWRNATYCLFVAGVSLFSLISLIRQTLQERDIQITKELGRTMHGDPDEADPVNVLRASPSRHNSLRSRSLLMTTHLVIFIGGLAFGIPALKSALYTHRGNAAMAEHNYDDAAKAYDSALTTSPYAGSLYLKFQDALAQRDEKGGGLGDMRRMANLHPGDEGNHNNLGNALMQRGDMADAIKEYQQAVALKPDDPIVHNNLGNALQAAHRYKESIAELRKALQLDPNQVPTYYNLANTLTEDNQNEEAVKAYRSAIEKNAKMTPAYYNLAQALAKLGKRDEAITAMDTFLQLASKQPEFADAVTKAKQQLNDWHTAH